MLASMFRRNDEKSSVTTPATAELRKTALNSIHRRLGAKMVNFGGWDMPLEYSGILAEHEAVRTRAGLFDVSHMGEIEIRGPGALGLVQLVSCNNAAKLNVGQAHYSGLMTSRGTFVDDLLVHKISDAHYLLCVNAGIRIRISSISSSTINSTRRWKTLGPVTPNSRFKVRVQKIFF